jgi:hypothetical protein
MEPHPPGLPVSARVQGLSLLERSMAGQFAEAEQQPMGLDLYISLCPSRISGVVGGPNNAQGVA